MATKTTTKKATAVASDLDQKVELFLQKKEKAKVLEKELEALKDDIKRQAEYEKREFVNGELRLSTGVLKQVAAAPSLVWTKTEKTLTPAEREKIALSFPEQYRKLDINTKLVAEVAGNNQDVANALGSNGVTLSEGTNYQIKAL